jgi:hypothetical protein
MESGNSHPGFNPLQLLNVVDGLGEKFSTWACRRAVLDLLYYPAGNYTLAVPNIFGPRDRTGGCVSW